MQPQYSQPKKPCKFGLDCHKFQEGKCTFLHDNKPHKSGYGPMGNMGGGYMGKGYGGQGGGYMGGNGGKQPPNQPPNQPHNQPNQPPNQNYHKNQPNSDN